MRTVFQFANPTRFLSLVGWILPWLVILSLILLVIGFYLVFFSIDEDYQQGWTIRIMFIHVPAAWLALLCYGLMAFSSIGSFVWRHPLADVAAKTAAPLGAAFTLICLLTGAFWGKPMWGTWWVWDARLTSMLILFLMYLTLIMVWSVTDELGRAGRLPAILTLVGTVNIPIIKFSVDWWNTLHQPASMLRIDGPSIHISLLTPLIIIALGMMFMFFSMHFMAMRTEILRHRIKKLQMIKFSNDIRTVE